MSLAVARRRGHILEPLGEEYERWNESGPFFVSMLAAFHRFYDVGSRNYQESSGFVVMDGGFSKLSGDRIEDCLNCGKKIRAADSSASLGGAEMKRGDERWLRVPLARTLFAEWARVRGGRLKETSESSRVELPML